MGKNECSFVCLCCVLAIAVFAGCAEPGPQSPGPDAASIYTQGKSYYDESRYDDAISEFNKTLEMAPSHVDALLYRGTSFFNKKLYDEAIKDYNMVAEFAPGNAEAYGNRGNAYNAKGQKKQALTDYNKALDINPGYFAVYINRGNLFLNGRLYDNAISDYSKAIELNPAYSPAYNNRGNAYIAKGKYNEAVADYTKAIESNPGFATAYMNRGNVFKDAGRYGQAVADYDKAMSIDKDNAENLKNQADAYFKKGISLIKQGDVNGVKMVERAVYLQSTNPVYHLNYGSVLALLAKNMKKKGSADEAVINAYRKAVAEWEIASLLYSRKGDSSANYVKCLFQLADAYEFVFRNTGKAVKSYQKALQIQPDHSLSKKALERLQKNQ